MALLVNLMRVHTLAAVLSLAVATPVDAEDRILVVSNDVPPADVVAVRAAIATELEAATLTLPAARRELARRAEALGPDLAVARRDEALARARRGYVHLQLDTARDAYDEAMDAELSVRTAADPARVARIAFERALISLAQRRDDDASADLVLAVTLDLDLAPDPDEYGPPVFRALDDARRAEQARRARHLTVNRSPADSAVSVDGRPLTGAGVDVRGDGPHLVVATRPGHLPRAFWTRADEGRIEVALPRASGDVLAEQALALLETSPGLEGALPAIARGVGADRYVTVRRRASDLVARLLHADTAREATTIREARGRRVDWEPRPFLALAASLAGRVLDPPPPSNVSLSVSAPDRVELGDALTLRAELVDGQRRTRRLLADCGGNQIGIDVDATGEHALDIPTGTEPTTLDCRVLAVDELDRVLARVPRGDPLSIAVVAPGDSDSVWYLWVSAGAVVVAAAIVIAIFASGGDDGRQYVIEGPRAP